MELMYLYTSVAPLAGTDDSNLTPDADGSSVAGSSSSLSLQAVMHSGVLKSMSVSALTSFSLFM